MSLRRSDVAPGLAPVWRRDFRSYESVMGAAVC
jgi:hypothetical protein